MSPRVGGENLGLRFGLRHSRGSSPHGRGKPGLSCPSTLVVGSSPHGRGKRVECGDEPCGRGLIPAWTGKTSRASTWPTAGASHPRVDGENLMRWRVSGPATGLSPRGRGKPDFIVTYVWPYRLIPARAGKTPKQRNRCILGRAHPRMGGENVGATSKPRSISVSSPHGRGKPVKRWNAGRIPRLIPARAGKTH